MFGRFASYCGGLVALKNAVVGRQWPSVISSWGSRPEIVEPTPAGSNVKMARSPVMLRPQNMDLIWNVGFMR